MNTLFDVPTVPECVLNSTIDASGYLRGSQLRLGDSAGHKEWLHFCVSTCDVDVLINFSVADEPGATQAEPREVARLTCLVRDLRGWQGDIVRYNPEAIQVRRGYLSLEFGPSQVHFANNTFHVRAVVPERGIHIELLLTPVTIPTPANNLTLEDSPPMHWVAVPRSLARGTVRTASAAYQINDALAYHDHNWGSFRWGRNFAWEWGFGLPSEASDPWSLVFLRLSNRARSHAFMQSLFVWCGARQHRVFRDEELQLERSGTLSPSTPFKLPRVMALLAPGSASDVPSELTLLAKGRSDRLSVRLRFAHTAQIMLPNDDDLGVTIINEVCGEYECEGTIRGQRLSTEGRCFVEFLGH